MRAAALSILLVVAGTLPVQAQLIPTTTEPPPPPTTTEPPPPPPSTAPETTAPPATDPPPETTAPPETRPPRTTQPREESPTTEPPPPDTTPGFVPPEGRPAAPTPVEDAMDAKTGLLPFFVVLSLGGFAVAIVIVGAQLVATRPSTRRRPAPRSGPSV